MSNTIPPEEVDATRQDFLTVIAQARQETEAISTEVREHAHYWMAKACSEGDEPLEWAMAAEARRAKQDQWAMDQALDQLVAWVEGRTIESR